MEALRDLFAFFNLNTPDHRCFHAAVSKKKYLQKHFTENPPEF